MRGVKESLLWDVADKFVFAEDVREGLLDYFVKLQVPFVRLGPLSPLRTLKIGTTRNKLRFLPFFGEVVAGRGCFLLAGEKLV